MTVKVVSDSVVKLKRPQKSWAAFALPRRAEMLQLTPLQLFTHSLTHEFHHKGQVLSMGRRLDYPPVDTDVIRF